MTGLETAFIALGTAVAKTACDVWMGNNKFLSGVSSALIGLGGDRLTKSREQRSFRRVWEQAADILSERLEPLIDKEFRDLAANEVLAAVEAVRTTFDVAELTEADLFAQDLDAGYLERFLRGQDPDRKDRAALSDSGALYDLLLKQSCAYLIETVQAMPIAASGSALAELLGRDRQILDELAKVLQRVPIRRGQDDFELNYRQLIANRLDHVEFFGATLEESSRRYSLSVAYLNLNVSGDFRFPGHNAAAPGPARVDQVLASTDRLFIRGEAGLGKTTLLQWIAVQCARQSFSGRLEPWNRMTPFFIPLRRHATGPLPTPELFLDEVGRNIAAEMPPGWAHRQLRSGQAIVLIDGVDELADDRREEVRSWLRGLAADFPLARYVVTSRPAAAPPTWLGGEKFTVAELEPMTRADVPVFIGRWHDAMRDQCTRDVERDDLDDCERQLKKAFGEHRHLRQLAGYPLLCALLCALNRDRGADLPKNRMELYDVALQMMLERRDSERRVSGGLALSRTDKKVLLRDIAYWLIRNDWTSAPSDRVRERIRTKLTSMAQVSADADAVYRLLLERSGLIREPVEGSTDFVHRSFQEFLAAEQAVENDDIGVLIANAYTDIWSEVVVMAAGHASFGQREELLRGLLDRSDGDDQRDALRLVAAACMETSPELSPQLRHLVREATAALLPPKTMEAAGVLARTGSFTLDLLARSTPIAENEVAATIRAAALIGDPAALSLIARFKRDTRNMVAVELYRAYDMFDAVEYTREVLVGSWQADTYMAVDDPEFIAILPMLKQLRHLSLSFDPHGPPVRLAFVCEMPTLVEIDLLSGRFDLSPLTGLPASITVRLSPQTVITARPGFGPTLTQL
ncbi:NACHT domain-containing protein [Phytomonospora sp. NPDC050363]|uniref:NACHT domain-containing protein n=1 Tax=Phytomonospora sp. NPDC050363 TaxID=3155642 RepID=UPI0033E663E2